MYTGFRNCLGVITRVRYCFCGLFSVNADFLLTQKHKSLVCETWNMFFSIRIHKLFRKFYVIIPVSSKDLK